jgi:DNA polymerase-3 subunit delta'
VAGREDVGTVLGKLEAVGNARRQLERNLNPQLVMEVLLLRLAA